jgi:hypothetical protein
VLFRLIPYTKNNTYVNSVNKTDRPKRLKNVDFRVHYDIVRFTNNHAEWHDEI